MTPLSPEWVERLIAGSAEAAPRPGVTARVALCLGSSQRCVLHIRDGRIVGADEGEADLELPLTVAQLDALAGGQLSLARSYMRGDVKPTGSSGAVLVAVEVLDDAATWRGLAG